MTRSSNQAATILIVDDDKVSVMAMKRAMRKLGFPNETTVAQDGITALEHLENLSAVATNKSDYVLVVLDMHMPRMCGFEMLSAMRERSRLSDHKVLACVGTGERTNPELLKPPVVGFVDKDDLYKSLEKAFLSLDPA